MKTCKHFVCKIVKHWTYAEPELLLPIKIFKKEEEKEARYWVKLHRDDALWHLGYRQLSKYDIERLKPSHWLTIEFVNEFTNRTTIYRYVKK